MLTIQEKARIRELHELLESTDFKILKCYECQILNEPMPYDVQALINQRRIWREELNLLEQN